MDKRAGSLKLFVTDSAVVFVICFAVAAATYAVRDYHESKPGFPLHISPGDSLRIQVYGALPNQPINGSYQVTSDGLVNLGYSYGKVKLDGLTIGNAEQKLRQSLSHILRDPKLRIEFDR